MRRLFLLLALVVFVSCKYTKKDQPTPDDLINRIWGSYNVTSAGYDEVPETISDQGRNGKISFFKSERNTPNIQILFNWVNTLSFRETTDITLKASGDTVLIFTWQRIGYVLGENVSLNYKDNNDTMVRTNATKQ